MFDLQKENIDKKYLILLIIIAYTFSIAVRMIWVYQFNGVDNFYWE